ncbi:MAG: hypothetical protein ACXVQV_12660, partial [Actinomycetota bacterium]
LNDLARAYRTDVDECSRRRRYRDAVDRRRIDSEEPVPMNLPRAIPPTIPRYGELNELPFQSR